MSLWPGSVWPAPLCWLRGTGEPREGKVSHFTPRALADREGLGSPRKVKWITLPFKLMLEERTWRAQRRLSASLHPSSTGWLSEPGEPTEGKVNDFTLEVLASCVCLGRPMKVKWITSPFKHRVAERAWGGQSAESLQPVILRPASLWPACLWPAGFWPACL